jgi:hypothetical protein
VSRNSQSAPDAPQPQAAESLFRFASTGQRVMYSFRSLRFYVGPPPFSMQKQPRSFDSTTELYSRADLRADSRLAGDIITAMATPLADHALQCDVPYRRLGQPRRTASGTQL